MNSARGAGLQIRILSVALAALAAGCGSSGPGSTTISSQPLSGKIDGQAWMFATGETNAYLSTGNQYWVEAYAESFEPCSSFPTTSADRLIMNFPKTVGKYLLSLNFTQTFFIAATNDNLGATSGEIDITDITATTITGGAKFAYNADNSVDGQFEVTICP